MANDKKFVTKNGLQTQNIRFINDNEIIDAVLAADGTLGFGTGVNILALIDASSGLVAGINDMSGTYSIEVDKDGTIRLAETTGNVLIGTATDTGHQLNVAGTMFVSGATTLANIDGVETLEFDTGAAQTALDGEVVWNANVNTLEVGRADTKLKIGEEMTLRVRNATGVTITSGTVVRVVGGNSGLPSIMVATADVVSNSQGTIGVVRSDIGNLSNGYATISGVVDTLDTSSFSAGDTIWLSGVVSGAITNVKPSSPAHIVRMGVVVASGATGSIVLDVERGVDPSDVTLDTANFDNILSGTDIDVQTAMETLDEHDHAGVYEPANPNLQSHITNTTNPHSVTKTQVGLANVDNTSDLDKPVSNAQQTALDLKLNIADYVEVDLDSHLSDLANPHAVTKAQVGLGSADNTSDLAKPISTLTQSALDGKAAVVHSHVISDTTGLQTALDGKLDLTGGTLTGTLNLKPTVGAATMELYAMTGQRSYIHFRGADGSDRLGSVGYDVPNLFTHLSTKTPSSSNYSVRIEAYQDGQLQFLTHGTDVSTASVTAIIDDAGTAMTSDQSIVTREKANANYLGLGGGTLTGNLTISSIGPNLILTETDTSTTARLVMSAGGLYVQAAASGGGFTGSGDVRFSGYSGVDIGLFQVRDNSAYQNIFHDNYHPNADTLTTARNIALTGDVTGNANFDGSGNISITSTVAGLSDKVDKSGDTMTGDLIIDVGVGVGTISEFRGEDYSQFRLGADTSNRRFIGTSYDGLTVYTQINMGDTTLAFLDGAGATMAQVIAAGTGTDNDNTVITREKLDFRIDKAFIDALNVDADTLDGLSSSGFAQMSTTTANAAKYLYLQRNTSSSVLYVNQFDTGPIARFFKGATSNATSADDQITFENNADIHTTGSIEATGFTGSGSNLTGIDADTLGGIGASGFVPIGGSLVMTGTFSTSGHFVSGRGSGGTAMTINDGYGNANLTFNHENGVPEQAGSSARIVSNADSTTAQLAFQLKSSVSAGVAVTATPVLTLTEANSTFANKLVASDDFEVTGDITGGLTFGLQVGSTFDDFTKHIDLYGDAYGFSITSSTLNIVSGNNTDIYSGATKVVNINATGMTFNNTDLFMGDNDLIALGDSGANDFYFVHNGTNSHIYHKNTAGDLYINSHADTILRVGTGNETAIKAIANGMVELRYNNVAKLATTNTGVTITGDLTTTGDIVVSGNQITMAAVSSRDKFRVWNNGTYVIGMQVNTYGGLTSWAMTHQMSNNSGQGFLWCDSGHSISQGAMALTTDGKLTVAHSMRIGYGESDTTTPGATGAGALDIDATNSLGHIRFVNGSDDFYQTLHSGGDILFTPSNAPGNGGTTVARVEDHNNAADQDTTLMTRLKGDLRYGERIGVTFIGTGTVTMLQSDGVSSVSDLGTGRYQVNFTVDQLNTSYHVTLGAQYSTHPIHVNIESMAVGSMIVRTENHASTLIDCPRVTVLTHY